MGIQGRPVCFQIFLPSKEPLQDDGGFEMTVIPTISTHDSVRSEKNYMNTYDHNWQFFETKQNLVLRKRDL